MHANLTISDEWASTGSHELTNMHTYTQFLKPRTEEHTLQYAPMCTYESSDETLMAPPSSVSALFTLSAFDEDDEEEGEGDGLRRWL